MAQPHPPGSPVAGDPSKEPAAGHVGPAAVATARAAADALRAARAGPAASREDGVEVALVLGSGLGPLAEEVEDAISVPFSEVPGMPASTAPGHAGRFVLGRLAGRRVALMQGRLHAYEGYPASTCAFPIRVLHALGAERLVVTNACGGLAPHWRAGDLMLQLDFINHTFDHALTGPSDGVGPRFPVTFDAYDEAYLESARAVARRLDVRLREGVYLAIAGPAYATRAELLDYCRRSADPVGRIVLGLEGCRDPDLVRMSDAICTGLQLVNFWQDITRDRLAGRIYLPAEDMARHGVTEPMLATPPAAEAVRALIRDEVSWARECFNAGADLPGLAPRSLRPAIAMFLAGGRAVADAIERAGFDTLARRPTVSRGVKLWLAGKALAAATMGRWRA